MGQSPLQSQDLRERVHELEFDLVAGVSGSPVEGYDVVHFVVVSDQAILTHSNPLVGIRFHELVEVTVQPLPSLL